jgi:hypothetical protein
MTAKGLSEDSHRISHQRPRDRLAEMRLERPAIDAKADLFTPDYLAVAGQPAVAGWTPWWRGHRVTNRRRGQKPYEFD